MTADLIASAFVVAAIFLGTRTHHARIVAWLNREPIRLDDVNRPRLTYEQGATAMSDPKPAPSRPRRRSLRDALLARKAAKLEEHRQAKTQTLVAMQGNGKHIYAGTVPTHVIAKRRARGKVAKASRRANRGRS